MENGPKLTQCQVPGQILDKAGNFVPVAPCLLKEGVSSSEGLLVCTAERRRTCADLKQKRANERESNQFMLKKNRKHNRRERIGREG
jgi:hypothetical protein